MEPMTKEQRGIVWVNAINGFVPASGTVLALLSALDAAEAEVARLRGGCEVALDYVALLGVHDFRDKYYPDAKPTDPREFTAERLRAALSPQTPDKARYQFQCSCGAEWVGDKPHGVCGSCRHHQAAMHRIDEPAAPAAHVSAIEQLQAEVSAGEQAQHELS